MVWSEEDQKVVVSAASAMSLKRSISSLDLAADARAARARRSARAARRSTPLKDTGLPPSPPAPPIDGRTLSDLEVLLTIATTGDGVQRRCSDSATRRQFETLVQLLADKTTTDKTTTDKGVNDLGPLRCGQVTANMCIRCGEPMPPNEMVPQCHWCAGRCCSFGCVLAHDNVCRAKPEGGEVDQVDGQQTLAGIGRSKQEQDQELPPAKGWKKYDTTYWEQEGCNLHLDLDDAHALAAKGLPDDGSNRSESFLDARWSRKLSAPEDPPEALEDLGPVALPPKDKGEDKHNVSLLRVATSSPPVSWPALLCGNIGNCPCISCTRRCIAPDPAARAPTHQADVGSPPKFRGLKSGMVPRIGKKERFSKPCPRHRQVGHRAGNIQLCAKPINCGCCMGTCQLCEFAKLQRSLTSGTFHTSKPFYCELYPHCGCDPTQDYLGLTTDSDLAFGADPFGDGAASDDLPQLESQPDSEGDAGWVAMLE